MRHAILGAGGIGGFVGAVLARGGADVLLLLRPETLARHPDRLSVESVVLGDFEVDVAKVSELDREVNVLWVTPKATQLESALALAPPERVGDAVVLPLMNGVDHVALLRGRYPNVLPGAVRAECERVEPGLVQQKTAFARIDLVPGPLAEEIAAELREGGIDVAFFPDEATLLWEKLSFIAPLALTTTALDAPVGTVWADVQWSTRLIACHGEVVEVGLAEGATLDAPALSKAIGGFTGDLRTSMQKDFEAGRPLELDGIAGPIVRAGRRRGIATPTTEELIGLVERALARRSRSRA